MYYTKFLFFLIVIVNTCIAQTGSKKVAVNRKHVKPADKHWAFESAPNWADEFNYTGKPDSTKWGYDTGGNGWGNNELEYYTGGDNSTVANGVLTIEARKEEKDGMHYTSSRMITKNKGDFLYGRFEIRAKLPTGKGMWPAIWMLPTDWAYGDWPASGEVDIMEQVGYDPDTIHISIHTKSFNHVIGTQKTSITGVPTATNDFHIYRVDWTPYAIRGYIDGRKSFEFINTGNGPDEWPFDKRFHLLLNIAVGGNWGGQHGIDDNAFPAKMDVDYVRVYKMKAE